MPNTSNTSLFYPIDIDECPDACVAEIATCTNAPGSFSCQCILGYQGDGQTACNGKNVYQYNVNECIKWKQSTLKLVFGGINLTIE